MGNEDTLNVIFTIGYLFFVLCFVAPPTEFVSAGLTIQNVLANYLGSEQLHFIEYHMKRTAITLLIHSLLPLGNFLLIKERDFTKNMVNQVGNTSPIL